MSQTKQNLKKSGGLVAGDMSIIVAQTPMEHTCFICGHSGATRTMSPSPSDRQARWYHNHCMMDLQLEG